MTRRPLFFLDANFLGLLLLPLGSAVVSCFDQVINCWLTGIVRRSVPPLGQGLVRLRRLRNGLGNRFARRKRHGRVSLHCRRSDILCGFDSHILRSSGLLGRLSLRQRLGLLLDCRLHGFVRLLGLHGWS